MQNLLKQVKNLSLNDRIEFVRAIMVTIEKEMSFPENTDAEEDLSEEYTPPPFQFQNKLNLTPKQINEIAQHLGMDCKIYIHKTTKEIIDIPEGMREWDDTGLWEETFEKVDNNEEYYVILEKMSSNQSYEIMESFVETLSDQRMISRLTNALERSKPFRNFKNAVDNHEPTRQAWFVHKQQQAELYVKRELDEATEDFS